MAKYFESTCLGCLIFFGITAIAYAEKATELYIPVGQSPGLSDLYNLIGIVDAVDYQHRSLTVTGTSGTITVHTTDHTLIFLDKSRLRQPNQYGAFSDLKLSLTVEVRFEAGKRHRPAEWIKLQIDK
jgi:hypothetical protein